MAMSPPNQRRNCHFHLLRYVPDRTRNEFVHIGVILREAPAASAAAADPRIHLRFTHDWRRVRCLHPDADTGLLEKMESELRLLFERQPSSPQPGGGLMRLLDESLSNSVQMTESKGYEAESIPAGLDELMRLYVDPPPKEKLPRLSGRAAIHAQMRSHFEHTGVWDLLRKRIAASDYTRPGDPLRLDLGYRPNGLIRMFHAVSLEPGVEAAKVLAFSSAALRSGVERVERADLELTAIVEPAAKLGATGDEPERLEMYRFGVETMEEHRIRVLTTSDLGRVAEAARRELRA
jgi:hypothetical protein